MQKLILLAVILLLLPIGFDSSIRADETDPPPDAGELGDPGENDETGDHPWGGEERSAPEDNIKIRTDDVVPTTLQQLFYFWLPSYYGIHLDRWYQYRPVQTISSHERLFQNQDHRYQLNRPSVTRRER